MPSLGSSFETGGSTYDGKNEPRSIKTTVGTGEATYRLGGGFSARSPIHGILQRRRNGTVEFR